MKVRYVVYDLNSIPVYDVVIPHVDCVYYEHSCFSLYMEDGSSQDFPLSSVDFTLEVIR